MMLCKITKTGSGYEQSRVVCLPKSEVELNSLLCDMNINRSNGYAYEVSCIKTDNGVLDKVLNETKPNVDELNHIAGEIDEHSEKWRDTLGEIMVAEQPENAVNFINIMHNADGYVFYDNIPNMSGLGKEVAFRVDGIDEDSPLGMCVDFKSYGESFHDVHQGVFVNGKYIIPPHAWKLVYDGVMLPGTDGFDLTTRLAVQIVSGERFGMNDDDRGIWLRLPTTEYTLDRTVHRLGESDIDSCHIIHAHYPDEFLGYLGSGQFLDSMHDINALAEVISSYTNPAQMEKLEAVMEFEGGVSMEQAVNIAANLDCYNFDPEITSAEDYTIKYYENDPVRMAQADELDGEKLLKKIGGKITAFGFVERNDNKMNMYYEPSEPEQELGITMQ